MTKAQKAARLMAESFVREVKYVMKRDHVSQKELARRLGKSSADVCQLLRGDRNLTIVTMTKISMALGAVVHLHVAPRGVGVASIEIPDAMTRQHARADAAGREV